MVQINWTYQAKDDLKSIALYISTDSIKYARLQINKIKERTQVLKSFSKSGRVVPEIGDENIRELIEGQFRIIYKICSMSKIDILTIYHSARDLSKTTISLLK